MMRVYRLVYFFEFEIESDSGRILGRIDSLQDTVNQNAYRKRLYESDLFRLMPSFGDGGNDASTEADEPLWTQRGFPPIGKSFIDFESGNDDHARQVVLETIERIREHIIDKTG